MVHRNETWAQGSQPGDQPIAVEIVPIPQEELDRQGAIQRLRAARGRPIAANEVQQLIADILERLDV